MSTFLIICAVVYGLVFGSFANALAYRIPTGESLTTRSHCPKCNAKITAWMNIPVLSWIFLRGKCATCKEPISIQYPLVEAITAILFGLVAWKITSLGFETLPTILLLVVYCYFTFIGVVLTLIDLKTFTLPTKLIYPTVVFSVVGLTVASFLIQDLSRLVFMGIAGVGLFLFYYAFWFLKPGALGFGDVRLSLPVGIVLGWISPASAVIGLVAPFILATIVFLPLMLVKKVGRKTKVPLGPWIVAGAILALLVGDILSTPYISVGGF